MTETLIEKLEAEKVDYESTMMDSDRAYNQAIDDCIAVVRQHEAAQPQDVQDLLRDMRRQVEYSDKATMPIPLYERMKVVITAMGESKSVTGSAAGCKPASLESDGSSPSSPTNTDTLIGKLEVIDLALDKSIDVNDEYMDEAKSLLTKLIKEVQQREIPVIACKEFPICSGKYEQKPKTIPWSIAEKAYSQYIKTGGSGQSLERVAERGGFYESEMDKFYPQWREETEELHLLRKENAALKSASTKRESSEVLLMLKKYRIAASRMCDRWSEGDQAVKNEVWKALHILESEALEVIERAEKGIL